MFFEDLAATNAGQLELERHIDANLHSRRRPDAQSAAYPREMAVMGVRVAGQGVRDFVPDKIDHLRLGPLNKKMLIDPDDGLGMPALAVQPGGFKIPDLPAVRQPRGHLVFTQRFRS